VRARIVIFLNPQEKAYCNNPRGSDSKPAVHSMYLSYLFPPPLFISNPPTGSSITGCRSTSYTLLTRYKSHAPLNRTNAARMGSLCVKKCLELLGGFSDGSKKNKVRRWKTAWMNRCFVSSREELPLSRRFAQMESGKQFRSIAGVFLFYRSHDDSWNSDCSQEFIQMRFHRCMVVIIII